MIFGNKFYRFRHTLNREKTRSAAIRSAFWPPLSGPYRQTSANPSQIPLSVYTIRFQKGLISTEKNKTVVFLTAVFQRHTLYAQAASPGASGTFLYAQVPEAPGENAHSYGVGKMIDLSCDKFMSICGLWPLDIWPDGHLICKAPVPAAPGHTPTPSKRGNCLIFLQCVLEDRHSFALLDMCRFAPRCGQKHIESSMKKFMVFDLSGQKKERPQALRIYWTGFPYSHTSQRSRSISSFQTRPKPPVSTFTQAKAAGEFS